VSQGPPIAVCAVDPGKTGCAALLLGDRLTLTDVPTVTLSRSGRGKVVEYDRLALAEAVRAVVDRCREAALTLRVVIEEPYYPQGNASQHNGTIGFGFGLWVGMFTYAGCPPFFVPPATWKAAVFAGSGLGAAAIPRTLAGKEREKAKRERDRLLKNNARELARRLFPAEAGSFARVEDHNRADAALLAYWGRRLFTGGWGK